jgi:ABC-2 type transport system permease protein
MNAVAAVKGSRTVLARFSFRLARRGSIIFGIAAGGMVALQGFAFAATNTTEIARAKFATALASNPALGILYGEIRNIESAAGYMVYRSVPFLTFIGSLWGLSVATRLMRGQEEDGQLELLEMGEHTRTGTLLEIIKGLGYCLLTAFVLCALILVAIGRSDKIGVSPSASIFLAVTLIAPAGVFMAVGVLTSQLASTRRRAMMYGVVILIISFALRSIGNVLASAYWLKYLTPFGWADHMHAVTGSSTFWLLPLASLAFFCLALAMYFVQTRDLYDSIIADNGSAEAHTRLLGSPFGLGFRLTRTTLLGWLMATAGVSALITGIAKTAASAVMDSPQLSKAIGTLTGAGVTNNIAVAFAGFSGFFVALLLMIIAATGLGRLREDEAKGYADNFLVGPVSRRRWLLERLGLLLAALAVICFTGTLTSYLVAHAEGINMSAATVLLGGFNYLGPALLLLGAGVLLFGYRPRLASYVLYAWIAWSFIVEIISSVVNFPNWIFSTSLLRHISIVTTTQPDWRAFAVLCVLAITAGTIGMWRFERRDLVSE